ncbi:PLC-like phosphodiesterase [Clohesyomyces aquaticus]|uniref:PLC-like phosphodiesterase n=1 Tax=Clohesyomyces aquaticus TaxID=1231657 RepID=A0A1Y1ZMJ2_9PLEO|nr:PLC-like phosphodiesterase [Clohesyomyces aquaticus]
MHPKVLAVFLPVLVRLTDARACNNSPNLCSKPYDMVTYLGAHDSPFLRDVSTSFSSFGNQYFNTTEQLDAGVRLVSAQVHVTKNETTGERGLHLCHTSCALFDAGLLRDWLYEIRVWMDKNLDEIVTILLVNSNGVDATELEGEYAKADIAHFGYTPPAKRPPKSNDTNPTWPTLATMIDSGQRLVSFIAPLKTDTANAPYLVNEWDFVWENNYMVTNPSNFTCEPDRPEGLTVASEKQSGRLFLMNHFLDWQQAFGIQVPDTRNINTTNAWDGPGALGTHMLKCAGVMARQATFVLVDFFSVGPAIRAVDIFNQVSEPVGRKNVTGLVVDLAIHTNAAGALASFSGMMLAVVAAMASPD